MLARRLWFVLAASCALAVSRPTVAVFAAPRVVAASALPAATSPATISPETSAPETPAPETASPETAPAAATTAPSAAPSPLGSLAPAEPPNPRASGAPGPSGSGAPAAGSRNAATTNALNALATSLQRASAPQPYAAFVRGTQRQSGVIDLLQKEDDLYLDLPAGAIGKTYLIAPVLASAIASDDAAFTGRIYEPLLVRFERVGHRVLWVEPNENYRATPGSPAARSLAVSVTDSVLNATPIVAEDDASKRIVVSAAFFLSDVENVGRDLAGRSAPTLLSFGGAPRAAYAVDATRSYFERIKALPANDEITASLAFTGQGADQPPVADPRNLRIRMHYSLLEAPALGGYRPRFADDRVGYFVETQKAIGENLPYPPFVRYIDRRDSTGGPIVYYLSNEIPVEYRETVRSAILAWNDPFARIGMPGKIEVRDAPSDGSFDPDDIRYSTIRWVTGEGASRVAFGPSITDPRTGQILRGEVVIDGEAISAFGRGYGLTAQPLREAGAGPAGSVRAACGSGRCLDDDAGGLSSAALGLLALDARGATLPQRAAYVRGYLRWVVMHEVGHTLGLAHNFAASGLYSLAQLHDPAFTARHPLAASVMDYTPVNLSPRGVRQGRYFQDQVGPYDRWAIRYGYERLGFSSAESERPALDAIARESSRPEYAFESDQDASGAEAIDPRVNAFDLSNDPLAFAQNQYTIDDQLLSGLDASFARGDRSYADERVAFVTQIRDYVRSSAIVAKYVGGAYVSRDHRGQPGAKPPLVPVPRAVSQRAFALLDRYVFSSHALPLSPRLLAHIGYDRFGGWGNVASRPDYPAVALISELQDTVLIESLLSPVTASRLQEAEYRSRAPGDTMTLADLFAWLHAGVFDDLGPSVRTTGVVHRGLQRRYARYLAELALAPGALVEAIGYPGDVPALARQELANTADDLDRSLRTARLDGVTRAHRADLVARIRRALSPTSDAQP